MPPPPLDEDDEMMLELAVGQGPRVQIPDDIRYRLDTRFRLELGEQLFALLTEVGVFLVMI